MMQRFTLIAGAVLGFLSVALGAFGAHALKPFLIERNRLGTFELAVEYQLHHALAMLIAGALMHHFNPSKLKYAGIFFFLGILLFSGSLYGLCFTGLGILGPVTPIGGVMLLIGWSFLAVGLIQGRRQPEGAPRIN
jgi:uncharacterized membrane protein YgdD (TMEM256/DUF423 family)